MYNIAMLSKEVVKLEHMAFELLMTFVSVMVAKALDELVDALKEWGKRRKRASRRSGKHFKKPE